MKDTKSLHVRFEKTVDEEEEEKPTPRVEYDTSISLEQSIEAFVQKKREELEKKLEESIVAPAVEKTQELAPPRAIFTTSHLSDKDLPSDPSKPKRKRKRARKNKDAAVAAPLVIEPPIVVAPPVISVSRMPNVGDHIGFSQMAILEDCTPGSKYQVFYLPVLI
jgi:hypothetical protein